MAWKTATLLYMMIYLTAVTFLKCSSGETRKIILLASLLLLILLLLQIQQTLIIINIYITLYEIILGRNANNHYCQYASRKSLNHLFYKL